jgi:type IV secretion system protein VirB10
MSAEYRDDNDRGALEEEQKGGYLKKIIPFIFVTILLSVGATLIYLTLAAKTPEPVEKPTKTKLIETVPEFKLPKKPIIKKPVEEAPLVPVPVAKPVIEKRLQTASIVKPARVEKPVDTALQRRLSSGLNYEKSGKNISSKNIASTRSISEAVGPPNIDFSVTETGITKASMLPSLRWIIPKGTPISCALDTAIQSDQAGLIKCQLTEDVYSADGILKLLDRGSIATGEYRVGSISYGKNRIFAIWDRIRTPDGVVINIASPATGPLGRAGIGGHIDHHYMERFGIAVLVSIVDDIFVDNWNNNNYETPQTIDSSIGKILEEYAKIKPTLHKNQGGECLIFTARDLDFSDVYRLENVK